MWENTYLNWLYLIGILILIALLVFTIIIMGNQLHRHMTIRSEYYEMKAYSEKLEDIILSNTVEFEKSKVNLYKYYNLLLNTQTDTIKMLQTEVSEIEIERDYILFPDLLINYKLKK